MGRRLAQAAGFALMLVAWAVLAQLDRAAQPQTSHAQQGLEAIKRADDENARQGGEVRAKRVAEAFDRSGFGALSDASRRKLSDEDARAVFEATNIVAFYTVDPTYVAKMKPALTELVQRGKATGADKDKYYKALASVRDFKAADAFRAENPDAKLKPLPALVDKTNALRNSLSELVVIDDGKRLVRSPVALPADAIVVVSHPLCHFSQDAIRAIDADPVLAPMFRQHSKWLAPPDRNIDFEVVAEWNQQRPDYPMTIAFRRDDWPLIEKWATPYFYFIRNGEVVATVVGWPKEGRKSELLAAGRKMGYLPPAL